MGWSSSLRRPPGARPRCGTAARPVLSDLARCSRLPKTQGRDPLEPLGALRMAHDAAPCCSIRIDQDEPVVRDQHVARVNISVDYTCAVEQGYRLGDSAKRSESICQRGRGRPVRQGSSGNVFELDERLVQVFIKKQ